MKRSRGAVNQSFTNAEVAEDFIQHVFDIDAAGQSAKGPARVTQLFGDQLLARPLHNTLCYGAVQRCGGFLKYVTVTSPGHDCRFASRKRVSSECGQRAEQCIEPLAPL